MDVLTQEELSQIARKVAGNDTRLVSHELGGRGETSGYMGKHLSLTLNLSSRTGDTRMRLFLKTYEVKDGKEDFLGETGIFKKEQDFYREVVEDVKEELGQPDWCPNYVFSKKRVLVLEDISEKGFEMDTDGSWQLDDDHLETALRTFASLHATSMLLEKRKSECLPVLYPDVFNMESLYDEHKANSYTRNWIAWQTLDLLEGVNHLEKYSHSEKILIRDKLQKEIQRIFPLSKKSEKYKNVITHGDNWKNNLLFLHRDGKPKECKMVDFQFVRYAPPAHDVMHILHYAVKKEKRERKQSHYLRIYYESLKERAKVGGIDVEREVPEEDFLESCKEYKELALIQSLLSLHYILGPVNMAVEVESYDKYEKYLAEHRKDYMEKFFQDEAYADKVKDLFEDLIDGYILNR